MKESRLESVQWLPRPLEEVFAFFADAGNLERIFAYRRACLVERFGADERE